MSDEERATGTGGRPGRPSVAVCPPAAPGGLTAVAAWNAVAGLGARFSGMLVAIVLTPFVLHRLGRDLYGISAAAASILEYLWLLRGGLGGAMRRYVTVSYHAGRRDEADRYYAAGFWWAAALRGVVLVAGVLLSHAVCRFLKVPDRLLADATIGVAFILVAGTISDTGSILEVPTYVTGRTKVLSGVRAGGALVRLVFVAGAFLLFRPSLALYGIAMSLVELVITGAIGVVGHTRHVVSSVVPRPAAGDAAMRRTLFEFGGLGTVSQVAAILYLATDNLLIGRIYGPAFVTEYSLGTRWSPIISGFLWAGVSAMAPLLTQLDARGDTARSQRAVLRAAGLSAALGVPMCLVPCVLGDVFLARWVGEEYRHCSQYLIAMLAPMVIGITLAPIWTAVVARGRIGVIATADVIVAVANPLLSLFLAIPLHMGLLGFALGNTAATLAKNLLLRPLLGRGEPGTPSTGRTLLVLPKALLGGAPALLLLYFAKPIYDGSLASVVLAGVVGGLLCLAGAALTGIGWTDLKDLAGVVVPRRCGR
jgi:O-antigen/teichoic acid export membrane protein